MYSSKSFFSQKNANLHKKIFQKLKFYMITKLN